MDTIRAGFFEVDDGQAQYLIEGIRRLGVADRVQVDFVPHPLTPDGCEAYAQYDAIAVFIGTKVSRTTLEALPRLRLVLTMSTGYDHIDIDACRERGVVVCNVPHYGENTVAEHTFALILSLSRKLHAAYFQSLRGEYQVRALRGFDLYGKTLGVVGAGSIGLHVIRIARGFGMRVLAYDARPQRLLAEVLAFTYTDLDTLLKESDIVTLHVPATPATYHLMNRETLSKMKRGCVAHQHGARFGGGYRGAIVGAGGGDTGWRGAGCHRRRGVHHRGERAAEDALSRTDTEATGASAGAVAARECGIYAPHRL